MQELKLIECTLCMLCLQFMLICTQNLQLKPQMLSMLFNRLAKRQNVIQVHKHKFAMLPEDVNQHNLKGSHDYILGFRV